MNFTFSKFEEVTKDKFLSELKERALTFFCTGKFSTIEDAKRFAIERMSVELLNKLTKNQVASPEQLSEVNKLISSFLKGSS